MKIVSPLRQEGGLGVHVLVTMGKHPKTLAVVRSLGRSGERVDVADDSRFPMSRYSKYCSGFHRIPSASNDPTSCLESLAQIVRLLDIELLIPMDDPECDLLSDYRNRSRLDSEVALPPKETYEFARNKYRTFEQAVKLGLRVPRTIFVRDLPALQRAIIDVQMPVVVKPIRSSGSRGLFLLREGPPPSFTGAFEKYGPLIMQELIPSMEALGVSCLVNNGEILASFTHRRVLQFPESGGPSIVRESTRNDEAERSAHMFLESINWNGVAMVEFLVDAHSGHPVLIEVNPRFWGSLPLAIRCGVDFPKLLCGLYRNEVTPCQSTYPLGIRCVNLLPFGIASILAGGFASKSVSLLRHSLRARCFDVESFHDPIPTLGAMLSIAHSLTDSDMVAALFDRKA